MKEWPRSALGAAALLAVALASSPLHACPPPGTEICDGKDNDNDGSIDEDPSGDAGEPPLCADGKLCLVAPGLAAQCSLPAFGGEFPCPAKMKSVFGPTRSGTGEVIDGSYCFLLDACGGCRGEHCDDRGQPICGVDPLPPCVCREDATCRDGCSGVLCKAGYQCRLTDPGIGTCQPNGDCRIAGGCSAGELCLGGACLPDPCISKPCAPDLVCRATATGSYCDSSCANITCGPVALCVGGVCYVPPPICRGASDAGVCPTHTVCRPDGDCGDPPCVGIHCPDRQVCVDGQCRWDGSVDASGSVADAAGPVADASLPVTDAARPQPNYDAQPSVNLKPVNTRVESGCGCSVPANRGTQRECGVLAALFASALARRRAVRMRR